MFTTWIRAKHGSPVENEWGGTVYPVVPPKVEYYVSEFGETLIPHLEQLKQWGQENFETIMENRLKNKY